MAERMSKEKMEKDHGSAGENEKKYTGVRKVNLATAALGDGKGHTHRWHRGDARGSTMAALGRMRGVRIVCERGRTGTGSQRGSGKGAEG